MAGELMLVKDGVALMSGSGESGYYLTLANMTPDLVVIESAEVVGADRKNLKMAIGKPVAPQGSLEFVLPNHYGLTELNGADVGLHLFVLRGTERFIFEAEVNFYTAVANGSNLYLRVIEAH